MGFNDVTAFGQAFSENSNIFGEAFTYQNTALVGVFDQVELDFQFAEIGTKKVTQLICVTSKPQWTAAALRPENRQQIVYNGIGYQIEKIDGLDTPAEPAFTLTCKKLT